MAGAEPRREEVPWSFRGAGTKKRSLQSCCIPAQGLWAAGGSLRSLFEHAAAVWPRRSTRLVRASDYQPDKLREGEQEGTWANVAILGLRWL